MLFLVTINGGNDFTVGTTTATLEGQGWINIREFRIAGGDSPLPAEWLDGDTWRVTLPLIGGANDFTLEIYDFQGALLDTHSLTITSTATTPTPREFLRITEIHYHPAGDDSTLEYIELHNLMAIDVDMSNWRLRGDADASIIN